MSLLTKKQAGIHENASTQINVPEDVAAQIIAIGKELIPDEHLAGEGRVLQPHVTVKYGVQPQAELLQQALAGRPSFPVALGKVVVFVAGSTGANSENNGIPVVIEVHGRELDALHDAVMQAMGTLPDDLPYVPHITIAYVKQAEAQHYAGSDAFVGLRFTAKAVALSPYDDDKQVDVPLAKAAATPAPVAPEIPQVAPQVSQEQEDEEVQRDQPATPARQERDTPATTPRQDSDKPTPKKRQPKLLQPKYKAPKPPAKNPDFKKWFGKSKVTDSSGKPLVVYHGTTHDFTTFDPSKTTKDSFYGQGLYFTSSKQDLENYANDEGPDLTRRIEFQSERLMQEWEDQWDDVKDQLGFGQLEEFPAWGTYERDELNEKAKQESKKEIAGGSGGMSMPVYLSLQNPVIVQKRGGTEFHIDMEEDENGEYTGNESGTGVDLYNAMMVVQGGYESSDAQEIWNDLIGNQGSDFTAYEFEQYVRNGNHEITDDNGDMVMGSFIADVYRELGFDGIIQDAYAEFGPRPSGYAGGKLPGMKMDQDTKHYILWDPSKVKSALGNVGKYDPKNPSITASAEPAATANPAALKNINTPVNQIRRDVRNRLEQVAAEMGADISVTEILFTGSRLTGNIHDESDLDVVVFYEGDAREDDLFNAANEPPLVIDGVNVDINPVQAGRRGELEAAGMVEKSAADEDEGYNDEYTTESWDQMYTLNAGTTLYHGSSNDWDEGSDLAFPAWFSTNRNVANWFANRNGDGNPTIRTYRTTAPYELVEFVDGRDIQGFRDMYQIEDGGDPNALAEGVLAAGFNGWIIPDNYRPGDDIMIGDGSHIEYVGINPADKRDDNKWIAQGSVMAANEKSVGDLGLARKIMHELIPVLGVQLPEPELKIVNQPRANWLGRDTWKVGYERGLGNWSWGSNTTIDLQRSILNDENTLRRIIAHELCHHAEALTTRTEKIQEEKAKGTGEWGYKNYVRWMQTDDHGAEWKKWAAKFNAKYGADFVTKTSDETYAVEELELKPYHILLKRDYDGKLAYEVSSRISPKMKRQLDRMAQDKEGTEYRLTMTNDRRFFEGHLIGSFYWVHPKDENVQATLEELWAKGQKVLPSGAATEQDELLKLMRERMTGPGWQRPGRRASLLRKWAIPQIEELELEAPVSKDYDRVAYVYNQMYAAQKPSLSWKDFQKMFPREQNSPLFTKIRQNRPVITLADLDKWLVEYKEKQKEYQNYNLEHAKYRDKATSFRDVEQLVLRINQSASAKEIIGEDEMLRFFLQQAEQGSRQSGHPVGKDTVGWLRVDFVNDDWLLIDEIQSDLINAVELAMKFISEPSLESLMRGYKSETVKQKIRDMGATEQMFQHSKQEFARRGYTMERLQEMKQSLVNLFKDWAEYGIASIIEIARRYGIKNVAIHTGTTIAKRDPDLEADKAVMYYDNLAKSFGFKKQQLDIGEVQGEFWTRTASRKTAGKRDEAVTSLTFGVDVPNFPSPVLVRWEQGMRWRQVLKAVKAIAGEIADKRVPWSSIHVWASLWKDRQSQDEGWEAEKSKGRVMFDVLHNGSYVRVDNVQPVAMGEEVIEASHKTPPLSDTRYNNPSIGEETNAYADIPERVRGVEELPALETLAPQMFEKEGMTEDEYLGFLAKHSATDEEDEAEWQRKIQESNKQMAEDNARRENFYHDVGIKELEVTPNSFWEYVDTPKGQSGLALKYPWRDEDPIEIHWLTAQERGAGRAALEKLCEVADKYGRTLGLWAVPLPGQGKNIGFKPGKRQLQNFYKGFGFKIVKWDDGYPWMVRKPQPVKKGWEGKRTSGARGDVPEGTTFRTEVHDAPRGQIDAQAQAWLNGVMIGYVNFAVTDIDVELDDTRYYRKQKDQWGADEWERIADIPEQAWVKYVYVHPDYRRMGIATGMYEQIKKDYPGIKITSSGTTEEGGKMRSKMKERGMFASVLLQKNAVYAEAQNQVQHTDHTPVGMYKVLKSNPFADEMEALAQFKGEEEPELNPVLEGEGRHTEGQPTAKGEDQIGKNMQKDNLGRTSSLHKFTPQQMESEAQAHENQFKPGEKGHGYADEFNWTQVDNLPVNQIDGDPKMWTKWFAQEVEWAHEGGREDYFEEMEKWWTTNPDEHIIVVKDGSKYHIWEGNHRVAIAKKNGMKTVPAFVGTRKKGVMAAEEDDFKMMGKTGPFYRIDTMRYDDVAAYHGKRFADKVKNGQPVTVYRAGKPGEQLTPGTFVSADKRMAESYLHDSTESFGGPEMYTYKVNPADLLHVENFEASELVWKPRTNKQGAGPVELKGDRYKNFKLTLEDTWHESGDVVDEGLSNAVTIRAYDTTQKGNTKNGKFAGSVDFVMQGGYLISANTEVEPEFQRQGVATAMYQFAEQETGLQIERNRMQSPAGRALWEQKNRSFGSAKSAKMVGPVYHGTSSAFENYESSHKLYYFTDDAEYAHNFLSRTRPGQAEEGANIRRAFLNISKPFDARNAPAEMSVGELWEFIGGGDGQRTIKDSMQILPFWKWLRDESKKIKAELRDQGYDSIIMKETLYIPRGDAGGPGATSYVVFSPNQIKWSFGKSALTLKLKNHGDPNAVQQALGEIHNTFPVNPMSPGEYMFPNAKNPTAVFEVTERAGRLRLNGIRSLYPGQRSGGASAALKAVIAIADKHGVDMELTASPFGDEKTRLDHDQLQAWYRRNRFEGEKGYDPSLGYMVRPKKADTDILIENEGGNIYGDYVSVDQLPEFGDGWYYDEDVAKKMEEEGLHTAVVMLGLEVENDKRGKGYGEDLLNKFLEEAKGLPVLLSADTAGKQQKGFKLVDWYKRHGFQVVKQNIFPLMVRW